VVILLRCIPCCSSWNSSHSSDKMCAVIYYKNKCGYHLSLSHFISYAQHRCGPLLQMEWCDICLSMLIMTVSPAQMAEPITMPFAGQTSMSQKNHVDRVDNGVTWRIRWINLWCGCQYHYWSNLSILSISANNNNKHKKDVHTNALLASVGLRVKLRDVLTKRVHSAKPHSTAHT